MAFRKVLETPSAINQRFFGGREWLDDGLQVVIVVHQFELNGSQVTRVSRDSQRGLGLIAVGFNECLEAEPL